MTAEELERHREKEKEAGVRPDVRRGGAFPVVLAVAVFMMLPYFLTQPSAEE